MSKLTIDKRFDIFIVDKFKDNTILEGSFIYCGCCGNPIGQLKKDLSFPFDSIKLKKSCKEYSLEQQPIGVRHLTCGHTMFSFKKELGFISLEKYLGDQVERIIDSIGMTEKP